KDAIWFARGYLLWYSLRLLRHNRRRRLERDEAAVGERQEHAVQRFLAGGDAWLVHQALAEQGPHLRHIRRNLEHVRQQAPWQRPLAVELARRRILQADKLALAPVDGVVAARRLLFLQRLLRLD